MKRKVLKIAGIILTGTLLVGDPVSIIYGAPIAGVTTVTAVAGKGAPTAGISLTVADYLVQSNEAAAQQAAQQTNPVSENETPMVASEEEPVAEVVAEVTAEVAEQKSEYADIAIAQVDNYVNVRMEPNTESEVVGKLYNNSAATILETTADGW